jgi:hypothetical protein
MMSREVRGSMGCAGQWWITLVISKSLSAILSSGQDQELKRTGVCTVVDTRPSESTNPNPGGSSPPCCPLSWPRTKTPNFKTTLLHSQLSTRPDSCWHPPSARLKKKSVGPETRGFRAPRQRHSLTQGQQLPKDNCRGECQHVGSAKPAAVSVCTISSSALTGAGALWVRSQLRQANRDGKHTLASRVRGEYYVVVDCRFTTVILLRVLGSPHDCTCHVGIRSRCLGLDPVDKAALVVGWTGRHGEPCLCGSGSMVNPLHLGLWS